MAFSSAKNCGDFCTKTPTILMVMQLFYYSHQSWFNSMSIKLLTSAMLILSSPLTLAALSLMVTSEPSR